MFSPRRPSAFLRYLVPALLLCLAFYYLSGTGQDISLRPQKPTAYIPSKSQDAAKSPLQAEILTTPTAAVSHIPTKAPSSGTHPIDTLIANAEKDFSAVLAKESRTLAEAAAAYRQRRGRHPPPGFDLWYNFAKENNAIIVEDFWDQVYHDLEPFWAIPPGLIRKQAWDYEMTIKLRNHKATAESDWFWTQIWLKLIKTVEHLLPDLDIALNAMDEPRLVVPWEDIDAYMKKAHKTRRMPDASDVVNQYQTLANPGDGPDKDIEVPAKEWEGTSMETPLYLGIPIHALTRPQNITGKLSAAAAHPPVSPARPRS